MFCLTISTYMKQKEKSLEHVINSGTMATAMKSPRHCIIIVKMEKLLRLWINDQCQTTARRNSFNICSKDLRLGEVVPLLHTFLNSALDRGKRSASQPGHFTPAERAP